jgi:aspartyl-tRNA(Asn)/glutamyl-tRNA(Gln) amidotransferase subunit A
VYTIAINLAGLPAISVSCGPGEGGMPVGLQFTGKPFDESTLLRVARAFEAATPHAQARPTLATDRKA